MTAVPHEGLRRGSAHPRAGARIVRPSSTAKSGTAASVAAPVAVSPGRGISLPSFTGAIAAKPVRLVLAGGRLRLGSGAFLFFVLGALSLMLFTLLMLNTSLAENSFRLQQLTQSSRDLTVSEQMLNDQLAAADSPAGLLQRARELGMVPAGSPVFIRPQEGQILGDAQPAPMPQVVKPKKSKPKTAPTPNATGGETPIAPGTLPGETPVGPVIPGTTSGAGIRPGAQLAAPSAPGTSGATGAGGEQSLGLVGAAP